MKIYIAQDTNGDIHIADDNSHFRPEEIVRFYRHDFPGKRKVFIRFNPADAPLWEFIREEENGN